MKVLVACEYSGIVRDAFIRAGHDAISVDLLPSESDFGPHVQDDINHFVCNYQGTVDLCIAHPPCTYLTNSGVRWLHEPDSAVEPLKGKPRWEAMRRGASFFNWFRGPFVHFPRLCIENPVMHRYARALCGKATQTFQPWHFGVPQFKRIGLQLYSLPPLEYNNVLVPPKKGTPEHKAWSKVHRASPGANRSKERSLFFREVADAMAEQWGQL